MKKRINFRPIFYSFVSLGLGIFFAKQIFNLNVYIIFASLLAFALVLFLTIKYKCISRFVLVVFSFVLGLGVFLLSSATFSDNNFADRTCTVSGRISTVTTYAGFQNVILDNTYIDGDYNGKSMVVSVQGGTTMEEGYVITFTAFVEKTRLFTMGRFNNYYYKYNIAYTSSVKANDVVMDDFKNLQVSEALRLSVKKAIFKNMPADEASISYASLFGDKTYVNNDIRDNFSISGVAHLLAVSGLHIGFLTTLLLFILNRTKLKKYVNLIIIAVFLGFYCYLCSFSVSVVRASVMFLVLSVAGILGKQYDKLNSLGIAGFVVLLYKPLSVFDAGFLLSFASVLSIFMFNGFFKNLFCKWKMPTKLANALAVIISVQLGLLPLTIYYYGKMSLLSILANFICIPIFEVFFISLFILVPIALILPFLGILLKIPSLIISFIIKVASIIAEQKWAIINLSKISPFAVVSVYMCLFLCSQFVNFGKKEKMAIITTYVICSMLITVGLLTPIYYNQNVSFINSYGEEAYVVELNNTSFCVGDYSRYLNTTTNEYFNNITFKNADYLLLTNNYSVPDESIYANVYKFGNVDGENILTYDVEYTFNNVKVKSFSILGDYSGVLLRHDNFKVFVARKELSFDKLYTINEQIGKIDLLILPNNSFDNYDEINADNLVINGKLHTEKYQTKYSGNWTITYNNGKIDNVRSID